MLLVDEKKLDTMLLDIKGKAYFIKSDIQNLRDIMDDMEVE